MLRNTIMVLQKIKTEVKGGLDISLSLGTAISRARYHLLPIINEKG